MMRYKHDWDNIKKDKEFGVYHKDKNVFDIPERKYWFIVMVNVFKAKG